MQHIRNILLVILIALITIASCNLFAASVPWNNEQAYYPMPVLFIHGTFSGTATWSNTISNLLQYSTDTYKNAFYDYNDHKYDDPISPAKWYLEMFDYEGETTNSIESHTDEVKDKVYETLIKYYGVDWQTKPNAQIILVGHSQGGLVARAFLRKYYYLFAGHLDRLICIGTPHRGAYIAGVAGCFTNTGFTNNLQANMDSGAFYSVANNSLGTTDPYAGYYSSNAIDDMTPGSIYLEGNDGLNKYSPPISTINIVSDKGTSPCRGDGVVSLESQLGIFHGDNIFAVNKFTKINRNIYITPPVIHTNEVNQWQPIFTALDGIDELDKSAIVIDTPTYDNCYTTTRYYTGKYTDHLPGYNLLRVELKSFVGNVQNSMEIFKNDNYGLAASSNGVHGLFNQPIELPNKPISALNTKILKVINGGINDYGKKIIVKASVIKESPDQGSYPFLMSAYKDYNTSYECLVSTTSPSRDEQNIALNQAIAVTFKEKIIQDSFRSPDVDPDHYTFVLTDLVGREIPVTYTWDNEYRVIIAPTNYFLPNTEYTLHLYGDDPKTIDDITTPNVIENLDGIQFYKKDPNGAFGDHHGFDPDYNFTFTTGLHGSTGGIGRGQPDDNYGVNTGIKSVQPLSGTANVGILDCSFGYNAYVLLNSLQINTRLVRVTDLDEMFNHPILVIPSGGMTELDNSATFKKKLIDYVNQGGTIICFTQQHGSDFAALPGAPTGFGWFEDENCQANSIYINELSAIFNGQTTATLNAVVDGYFTKWPENAKQLLKRTKNDMPAMIEYTYGKGRVIAASLYSDWGYMYGQASTEETTLVKQIVNYALNPVIAPTQSLIGRPGKGKEKRPLLGEE